ncbi:hypothetical protein AMATHDRAFT_143817 [Amanita thiersii Skay4041]|uniref:Calcineurin-like phosphoesterase domain-containing protein n=1 Tax=Amanita thiersii Skay4041 TaxID=703135 RepID=A0A2A9NSY5_9AGAR|nr:hypothetical protein AMATHDRAFT_143817 [Amanita thiersii Skay4041]
MKLRVHRNPFLTSTLHSPTILYNTLRFFWVVLVIWYELGEFYWSLSSCRWPAINASSESPTHVLVLSDTQIIHTAYTKNVPYTQAWRRFLTDLNIRKNWHVTSRLRPHDVIFLGDMLAAGRFIKNSAEYEQAVQYFKSVFSLPGARMHYLAGNTDISLGTVAKHSKDVKGFYQDTFGPLNQEFAIRKHTFVGLDAPGLVDEDYQRAAQGVDYTHWTPLPDGPVSFVNSITIDDDPLILLSHIPLSRPITASCGPLREKDTLRRNVGHGYQSMLGKQTTAFLLETLRPSLIFSGDNRDYCEYKHSFPDPHNNANTAKSTKEVTVKSFSMSKHIHRPGFQLLSLVDPFSLGESTDKSFADILCLLPDQDRIYSTIYPTFTVITLLVLFVINKTKMGHIRVRQLTALSVSSQTSLSLTSGRSTPVQHLDADIWIPRTPNILLSPRSPTQSLRRIPSCNLGPKLRTPSRPVTPNGSPPRHYVAYQEDGDEEEAMYPMYSTHHSDLRSSDHWSSGHDDLTEDELSTQHERCSAPGWRPVETQNTLWSWSFVFRGRRRRLTLSIPSWEDLTSLFSECQDHSTHLRRRGVLIATLFDTLSVLWPAVLVGMFIAWCMF